MKKAGIAAAALITVLVLLALVVAVREDGEPSGDGTTAVTAKDAPPSAAQAHPGFIYGRVTASDGMTYQGRLRWGGDQEAFWSDLFNGVKSDNPWVVHAPGERRDPIEVFGFAFGGREPIEPSRPFMTQFGNITRIEAHVGEVQVTLKSGTMMRLDRFEAGDIDDGVRVWDAAMVNVDSRQIRRIDFLATAPLVAAPSRLYGTVRTQQGDFTGFIEWDGQDGVGSDELSGRTADGELRLRYDDVRSIANQPGEGARVTLRDGRELLLSGSRDTGDGSRGIAVEDPRYGRVTISWQLFERADFSVGGGGAAYGDFPPGRPLAGSVTTRDGRRLSGRLVYDFDESETTETLDAERDGLAYNLPFGLIASIVPGGREGGTERLAAVTLRDGEELLLERSGDLGDGHAGMLVFRDDAGRPDHVPWRDVERIDFDGVPPTLPPAGTPGGSGNARPNEGSRQ
jgi:hypothetical protein